MAQQIEMESPVPPDALLERLAQYARQWRESKLPAAVRARGIYGCRVAVRGSAFELELEPQGNGPQLVWRGDVTPGAGGAGSRRRARAALTRGSKLLQAGVVAVILGWWAAPQVLDGSVAFPVFGVGSMLAFIAGVTAWRASDQAPLCQQILAQLAGAPAALSPLAT
jgi:hypothetical protein